MTDADIERWAREAGWTGIYTAMSSPTERYSITVPVTAEQVCHFAAAIAEHCASIADREPLTRASEGNLQASCAATGAKIGEAIRAEFGLG